MKHLISFILSFYCLTDISAQVRIGTTAGIPDASAVLELDGGATRGFLLPRMRTIDILAIPLPAEGLTVYSTDQQSLYMRRSGDWIQVNGNGNGIALPYFGQFNYNGTVFDVTNQFANGICIQGSHSSNGYGVRGFSASGIGINGLVSDASGVGGYFVNNAGERSLISMNRTGIGTSAPVGLLHIDASNTGGNTVTIDDDIDPVIQFRRAGINKSVIKQLGNDLVFRPNDQNFAGKVIIQSYNSGGWFFVDANGDASLGVDPSGYQGNPLNSRLNIRSNSDVNLTLDRFADNLEGPSLAFVNKVGNSVDQLGSITATTAKMTISHQGEMEIKANGGMVNMKASGGFEWRNSSDKMMGLSSLGMLNTFWQKIGTLTAAAPEAVLHVVGNSTFPSDVIYIDATDPLITVKNQGVGKGFIQVLNDDMKIGTFATNNAGNFVVRTNGADRMLVRYDGKMILGNASGTAPAGTHLLAVKGKIAATEFDVVATGSWPDYVFDPSYKLRSLQEVESFIKQHNHLPGIPAAAIIEKEGFGLGDMQKRMIEKIEELTLYLIDAKKEIDALKQQVKAVQEKK